VNAYQTTMSLRHAKRRLEACRHREARAGCLYGKRVRETERAEQQYRQQRRRVDDAICAALSLWEG